MSQTMTDPTDLDPGDRLYDTVRDGILIVAEWTVEGDIRFSDGKGTYSVNEVEVGLRDGTLKHYYQ